MTCRYGRKISIQGTFCRRLGSVSAENRTASLSRRPAEGKGRGSFPRGPLCPGEGSRFPHVHLSSLVNEGERDRALRLTLEVTPNPGQGRDLGGDGGAGLTESRHALQGPFALAPGHFAL